ncbi:FAD:protein FMN transferase [Cryobacterium shii]
MGVHTFETMGTVVSIRLATDAGASAGALADVHRVFDDLDQRFSLYAPESELSLIVAGVLPLSHAGPEMRGAYTDALGWRERTNGAFTPHRPDGVLDLSGLIKGVAVEQAGLVLERHGHRVFSINAGGDILTGGVPAEGTWITGITDAADRTRLLTSVGLTPDWPAAATSGSAERGNHIWRRPDTDRSFLQATVIAGDIVTADVLATAIIAGGRPTLDHVTDRFRIAALVQLADGALLANPAFRALIARDPDGTPSSIPTASAAGSSTQS